MFDGFSYIQVFDFCMLFSCAIDVRGQCNNARLAPHRRYETRKASVSENNMIHVD